MRLDVTKPPQVTKNSTVASLYMLQAVPRPVPRAGQRALALIGQDHGGDAVRRGDRRIGVRRAGLCAGKGREVIPLRGSGRRDGPFRARRVATAC